MARRLALAVVGAFAISLLVVGAGGAAVCDPHCAPTKSNQGSDVRGLNRALDMANQHGKDNGLANAVEKQDAHKPGGSGVSTGTGGTGGSTGGDTGGSTPPPPPPPDPCSGC